MSYIFEEDFPIRFWDGQLSLSGCYEEKTIRHRREFMGRVFFLFVFLFPKLCAAPGIEYSEFSHIRKQDIHVIEVDPSLYEIQPVKALDSGIGRESVLSLSTRYGAIAAINGGFFSIGSTLDGKACGALKIHDWFALPFKPRGCIGWSTSAQIPKMDRLLVKLDLRYRAEVFAINGLNRSRNEGEMILYTPCFHKTTLTNPDGKEIIVVDNLIQSIVKKGSTKIPERGFVLSIQNAHPLLDAFSVGDLLTVDYVIEPILEPTSSWNECEYVVGGTPLLLHDKTKEIDFAYEQTIPTFLSGRHARTAVGVLPNGNWVFVVVDQTDCFDGMTMYELADLMRSLGCTHALNLDGGGSSTMIFEGEIKNNPRGDEDEDLGKKTTRRVSDAIVICPINY